ncbi:hypothetical protein [Rhizobium leguminosarum]|uniref:hypothetical protein n=1 Tax=Rhizobium leguminosarum TaxID=384 RepID=UPI003F9E0111
MTALKRRRRLAAIKRFDPRDQGLAKHIGGLDIGATLAATAVIGDVLVRNPDIIIAAQRRACEFERL